MEKIDYKHLPLVGEGCHGKVYRLDKDKCLKICKKTKDMQLEYNVLKRAQGYRQFPKIYECEDKYMIREFVDGQNIRDYIKKRGLTINIAKELTELINVFIILGFKRIDIRMHEVFVTKNSTIKIVDTTRYLDKKASYPRKMLRTLNKLGYQEKYMEFLRFYYPQFYFQWENKIYK